MIVIMKYYQVRKEMLKIMIKPTMKQQNPGFMSLRTLDYGEVTVKDPELLERLHVIGEFYLSIPTNDAFYEMRKKAGLDTYDGKSLVYGRSWFEEGGIVLGQWLQAFCRFFAATGDKRFLQRVTEYVEALAEVQKTVPDCYICGTAYMAEKVFHGLMDAVELCGISEAYYVCKALFDNFREIPAIKNAKCRLGDNGGSKDETYREIEWYTLSEAVYRFADMAKEKMESKEYIEELETFGKKFEYDEFWNIFLEGRNLFDFSPKAGQNTDFFHAYSHLNSFNSAAYLYKRTGDGKYLEAAEKFQKFMTETQMVATGGFGTILEWLLPKDRMIDALEHCHCTFENQCNTYATLRLNRFLSTETGNLQYGNQSERLYYNSFLASLETDEEGHAFYYSDYCADGGKKKLNPISWTCCSGTRPLAAMEILKNIYFRGGEDSLYINLFIPSEIECRQATVSIEGNYIQDGNMTIKVSPKQGEGIKQKIYVRKPFYVMGSNTVLISGASYTEDENQYTFDLSGEEVQEIHIRFPKPVYAEDIVEADMGVRAFLAGPLVLAAKGHEHTETPEAAELRLSENGTYIAGADVFKPYKDYAKDEEYRMYFKLKEEA